MQQCAAHRGNYRACSGRYEPRPGSGDVIAERGDDVTEATEEKPRPGPEGGKPAQQGAGLRLQKGEDCKHRGVAGYGGKENRRSLRSCVVVEDALNAMRIIYNRHIIDPVVENESMAGSRNS